MPTTNTNEIGPEEVHSEDIPPSKLIYLVYARVENWQNWIQYARTDDKNHAIRCAQSLYRDFSDPDYLKTYTVPESTTIIIVTIYESNLPYTGIPSIKGKHPFWYDYHMIPFMEWHTLPDQTIHNGEINQDVSFDLYNHIP